MLLLLNSLKRNIENPYECTVSGLFLELKGYPKYKEIYLKSLWSLGEEGLPSRYVDLGLTSVTPMCKMRETGEREDEKKRKGKEKKCICVKEALQSSCRRLSWQSTE